MLSIKWDKYHYSNSKSISRYNIKLIDESFSLNKLFPVQQIHAKYAHAKMVLSHVQLFVLKMSKHAYLSNLKIQTISIHGYRLNQDNVVAHVTKQKVPKFVNFVLYFKFFFSHHSRE